MSGFWYISGRRVEHSMATFSELSLAVVGRETLSQFVYEVVRGDCILISGTPEHSALAIS